MPGQRIVGLSADGGMALIAVYDHHWPGTTRLHLIVQVVDFEAQQYQIIDTIRCPAVVHVPMCQTQSLAYIRADDFVRALVIAAADSLESADTVITGNWLDSTNLWLFDVESATYDPTDSILAYSDSYGVCVRKISRGKGAAVPLRATEGFADLPAFSSDCSLVTMTATEPQHEELDFDNQICSYDVQRDSLSVVLSCHGCRYSAQQLAADRWVYFIREGKRGWPSVWRYKPHEGQEHVASFEYPYYIGMFRVTERGVYCVLQDIRTEPQATKNVIIIPNE